MWDIIAYATSLTIVLGIVYVLIRQSLRSSHHSRLLHNVPSIPSRYPFSNLVDLIRNPPWNVLQEWTERFGGVVRFHFFGETYVVAADPELIRHVLTNIRVYNKDRFTLKPFLCLLGTGLVSSEGVHWRRQRALITSVFRVGILEEGARTSFDAAIRLANKLSAGVSARGGGGGGDGMLMVEMAEEFRHMTLQVIGATVLSLPPDECDRVFPDLYLPIAKEANKRTFYPWRAYLPLPASLHMNRCIRELNTYITDIIMQRCHAYNEAEPAVRDILDRIIAGVDDQGSPRKWQRNSAIVTQIRDEIKTFLFAGHETTSMMLTWTLFELSRHPECLERVRAEARAVFPDGDFTQQPSFEALQKMDYTFNVLRETLRLYSVVPVVTREAIVDDRALDKYTIPRGAHIAIHMKAVHHNQQIWPQPSEYRPERFEKEFHPYAWIPFINGPRNCVGQHFAMLEARVALAVLLLRFSFQCTDTERGEQHHFNIPVEPIHRMQMNVRLHR